MVASVIRDYMEGGATKLTVPGFGTFMRRGAGEIVFVDLLRGDDPTLSQLVEDTGGYSELEAMALIDRFIFRTKSAIERQGSAAIERFGTMTMDAKGIYQFRYAPVRARKTPEHAVQEKMVFGESLPAAAKSGAKSGTKSAPRPASRSAAVKAQPIRRSDPSRKYSSKAGRSSANKKAGKTDWLLLVALIAAGIAIVAMYFGLSRGTLPFVK